MRYHNPIIPGFHPDPSICRVGGDFYLVTSSFEYFPGVPIFHSRDLVHWQQIGHCLTRPSQLPLDGCRASGGIWAPTLRYNDAVFCMTTTNVTGGGHFFVTAADPAGEWSEPIWVEGAGFDASLFFDEGRAYFQWYVYPVGIHQTEIDLATGKHLTASRVLWNGSGGRSPEGPHLYKIGDFYYLLAAEGGTEDGHMVTIARSQTVWGPWESCPGNPILSHRSLDRPIQTTGHGDLVQAADGSWWMVFLGTRPVGYPRYHLLGRETFLAPVIWEDGWPVVGNRGTVDLEMDAALLDAHPWNTTESLRDEFDHPSLGFHWNWLRNPDPTRYSVSARPGWLRLLGAESTLNDPASPTFLGRRQRHLKSRVTTLMDFHPQSENEEAGLVVLGDNHHHYEIGITCQAANRVIFVRRKIGTLQAVVAQQPLPEGQILLRVDADEAWYTFRYAIDNKEWLELARGETRYLSSESGAAIFTGTYFGIYATGNGQPCQTPADFDWFEYEIMEGPE
ncbi:MAG TPA: glycoside hydrolase family 43 protein [Anaerolineales bacterium]|nr:glycoside hydrolase family 43 protein [Anaerolineales bacterium]